jgi:hypothetical protein
LVRAEALSKSSLSILIVVLICIYMYHICISVKLLGFPSLLKTILPAEISHDKTRKKERRYFPTALAASYLLIISLVISRVGSQ